MHCPNCNITVPSSYLKCPTCGNGFNGTNSESSFSSAGDQQNLAEANPLLLSSANTGESIGGWLILPAIFLPFSILRTSVETYNLFKPILEPGAWDLLTNPSSSNYIQYFSVVAIFEMIFNITLIALACYSTVLFYKKSHKAPKIIIYLYLIGAIGQILDQVVTNQLMAVEITSNDIGSLVGICIMSAIWIMYFLKSERVKRTFVNP